MVIKGVNLGLITITAGRVLISPKSFFKEMPKKGGFVVPLIFVIAMGVIGGLIQSIFSILGLHIVTGIAVGESSIIILPVFIVIFSFIAAGIFFIIWKMMGSNETYETAYRCAAYISVLTPINSLLGIIPYIGGVVSIAITTLFLVIASKEVHNIPSNKAWLVFGLIGAIFIIISISGEYSSRRVVSQSERFHRQLEEAAKEMQEKAEKARKAAEEAQKAAEKIQKKLQKSQTEKEK